MVSSNGLVLKNIIKQNQRHGIHTAGSTNAHISKNTIEGSSVGVVVKTPSEPFLEDNNISKNTNQIELDKAGASKMWKSIK